MYYIIFKFLVDSAALDMQKTSSRKRVVKDVASDEEIYREKTGRSLKLDEQACKIMPGGQSHNARFFEPYPFYAEKARGKYIWDVDGNRYVDYWMGHTALILGHSPAVVAATIKEQVQTGYYSAAPTSMHTNLRSS